MKTSFLLLVMYFLTPIQGCATGRQSTYTNPVWNHDWPDPTVWIGDGSCYYSIATGGGSVIRSKDLAHWEDTGIRPFNEETFAKLHQYGKWLCAYHEDSSFAFGNCRTS